MKTYYVYLLCCSDDTFYTGVTNDVWRRLEEHQQGLNPTSYTYKRRPVTLSYFAEFSDPLTAIAKEKQIKKWSKAKKQALIDEHWDDLIKASKKRFS